MATSQPFQRPFERPAAARPSERAPVTISIVMPCLNEEGSIATCVRKAWDWLRRSGYSGEVLSSTTAPQTAPASWPWRREPGWSRSLAGATAAAYLTGIPAARGKYIVMGDCDNTYDFTDLEPLIAPLRDGHDMVVGNRYAGGIRPGAITWSHRYIGTPLITSLLRMFTGARLGDSQCGLRSFTQTPISAWGCTRPAWSSPRR